MPQDSLQSQDMPSVHHQVTGKGMSHEFAAYRASRLKAGVKPETVNREHAHLCAMFNELRRLGTFKGDTHWMG
jgi:hypothetical protein